MRIPREFPINGNTWTVRFVRNPGGYCGETEVDGCCCPDLREIHLAFNLDLVTRWETLAHECCHAVAFEYGERFPSLRKLLDNHKVIRRLEGPVAEIILGSIFPFRRSQPTPKSKKKNRPAKNKKHDEKRRKSRTGRRVR